MSFSQGLARLVLLRSNLVLFQIPNCCFKIQLFSSVLVLFISISVIDFGSGENNFNILQNNIQKIWSF